MDHGPRGVDHGPGTRRREKWTARHGPMIRGSEGNIQNFLSFRVTD